MVSVFRDADDIMMVDYLQKEQTVIGTNMSKIYKLFILFKCLQRLRYSMFI